MLRSLLRICLAAGILALIASSAVLAAEPTAGQR